AEIFCNNNVNDLEIVLAVEPDDFSRANVDPPCPKEVVFTIPRASNSWRFDVTFHQARSLNREHAGSGQSGQRFFIIEPNGKPFADISSYLDVCGRLADTVYIGAFRNAINLGATTGYYDLNIGQAFITQWRNMKTGLSRSQNEATYRLTDDI